MEALRSWLGTPVSAFSMDFEAIIRLLVAPIGTSEQAKSTLEQVQADAQDMLRFAGEVKKEFLEGRNPLQDQAYLRALAVDFFISLLYTVQEWTERTLAEVEKWKGATLEQRNSRAIEIFRHLPVDVPEASADGPAVPPSTLSRRRS